MALSCLSARPLSDDRGTVTVEYVVLLCLVALLCCGGLVGLGVPLFHLYLTQEAWLGLPVP